MTHEIKDEAYWKAFRQQQEEAIRVQSAALLATLTAQGVAVVEAHYNGGGDNGCVEEIIYKDANDNEMTVHAIATENAISDVVCNFLPDGWEINEGSSGTVILNVAERKLDLKQVNAAVLTAMIF